MVREQVSEAWMIQSLLERSIVFVGTLSNSLDLEFPFVYFSKPTWLW